MKYQINPKYKSLESIEIWNKMIELLEQSSNLHITSISGKKVYEIITITDEQVGYLSDDRNNGEEETIYKEDFVKFLDVLRRQGYFSTSSIKEYMSGALYKKRSPSFAILKYLNIIE